MIQQDKLENRILRSLAPEDFALLQADLERRTVNLRDVLVEPHEPIRHAYFPESGIVSLVTPGDDPTEVGIVGKEGFVGIQIVLGVDRAPWQTFGQIAGEGHTIPAAHLARAVAKSPTLREALSHYVYLSLVQATETAYANAHYTVEQRLARWILLCQNRVGDELELTHEFIAMMLGVRRPGVTVATHVLEGFRLIYAKRGLITVRNREGLVEFADGSYGMAERELERLLGPPGEAPSAASTP